MAGADAVFCAVGTTNSKVQGDKELYKKVDYDIPVFAAKPLPNMVSIDLYWSLQLVQIRRITRIFTSN